MRQLKPIDYLVIGCAIYLGTAAGMAIYNWATNS